MRNKYPDSELFWSVFSRLRMENVSLRIQSECGKIRTKISLNMDTFYAVLMSAVSSSCTSVCSYELDIKVTIYFHKFIVTHMWLYHHTKTKKP